MLENAGRPRGHTANPEQQDNPGGRAGPARESDCPGQAAQSRRHRENTETPRQANRGARVKAAQAKETARTPESPATRRTPRQTDPKDKRESPERACAPSGLLPRRPCGHLGLEALLRTLRSDAGREVRAGAASPQRARRPSGVLPSRAVRRPLRARRERHEGALPPLRGPPDCSDGEAECRRPPEAGQPNTNPSFRERCRVFASAGETGPATPESAEPVGAKKSRGADRRGLLGRRGSPGTGEAPGRDSNQSRDAGDQEHEAGARWRRPSGSGSRNKRDPEEALAGAAAPSGPQPFASAPLSVTPWR